MRPVLIHYLLMGAVALTTIAAFKSVGVILVVGMLIAPAAAAYLVTSRLHVMIGVALLFGALSAVLGYGVSLWITLPFEGVDGVSISGSMTVVAGLIFLICFLFSPTDGLIPKWINQFKLSRKMDRDNFLVYLYREIREQNRPAAVEDLDIRHGNWSLRRKQKVGNRLADQGYVRRQDGRFDLTDKGREKARSLLRSHRLWETFAYEMGLPEDHVHGTADEMEHYIDKDFQKDLEETLGHPEQDPHGKDIPREADE
jgi:manganese/zinc/iron transport system permease protein